MDKIKIKCFSLKTTKSFIKGLFHGQIEVITDDGFLNFVLYQSPIMFKNKDDALDHLKRFMINIYEPENDKPKIIETLYKIEALKEKSGIGSIYGRRCL